MASNWLQPEPNLIDDPTLLLFPAAPTPLLSLEGAFDPEATESAPSFPGLPANPDQLPEPPRWPEPGERLDDFELLQLLGEGSFSRVFLARQHSLHRLVALKVAANHDAEAQTLARLDHDHIVRVYSESIDRLSNLRLLCMQYVPGTTLDRIIAELKCHEREHWDGNLLVSMLERLCPLQENPHPGLLRDRTLLARSDWVEAVCWLGARLAEALDYAHAQGVLHRDVKPANILVNQFARPLLTDFNLSQQSDPVSAGLPGHLGGTPAYMAPEHLDALVPEPGGLAVDERADIYSLGVVLFELLEGARPFRDAVVRDSREAMLRAMAEARRAAAPLPLQHGPAPRALARVLLRCLDPEPARRFGSAAELARALEGCRELRCIERGLPEPGLLTRAALRAPVMLLLVVALLPQVLSSIVNIAYNALQIVSQLSAAQQEAFFRLVFVYNLLVYPLCIWLLCRQALPVLRLWSRLERWPTADGSQVSALRRRMLGWPEWTVLLSCLGWLPCAVVFPLGIGLLATPVELSVFVHFLISFTLSGLIALTYSFFLVQFVVLRVLYSRLWVDVQDLRATTRAELRGLPSRLRLFQLLAGAIPLAGAVLLVTFEPDLQDGRLVRLLAASLILLGMAGFALTLAVNQRLSRLLGLLTGS